MVAEGGVERRRGEAGCRTYRSISVCSLILVRQRTNHRGIMDLVSTEQFLAWTTAHGIGRSPKYPHSESLTYPADASTWYRYRYTPTVQSLPQFVDLAVRTAAAGSPLWLFPPWRGGQWYSTLRRDFSSLTELSAIISDTGVPAEYAGAIRCEVDEVSVAARLLAGAVEHAGSLWQLCVIPGHAKCILQSEEDGDLLGYFPADASCASFTHALRQAGWQEPTEPDPRVSETDPWLTL
jgi:hypothetical protein